MRLQLFVIKSILENIIFLQKQKRRKPVFIVGFDRHFLIYLTVLYLIRVIAFTDRFCFNESVQLQFKLRFTIELC